MSTTQTAGPERSAAWLDEGDINPQWAAPAGEPSSPSRVRRWLVYGSVLVSLVLVLGLVLAAGGFGRRTDLLTPVEPGALIVTGPFELTFTEATAQVQTDSDGTVQKWEIVAIGQARNTGEETLAPTVYGGDTIFGLRDPATGLAVEPSGADIGDQPTRFSIYDRDKLTPGLPMTGYRVRFEMPAEYQPGATVRLGVAEMVFEDKFLVSDEKAWDNGQYGVRIELPIRVLPPEA